MLEEDVMRVVEDSKKSRKILGAFNSTFLTLIPKKDNQHLLRISGLLHYVNKYMRL
jgi:hypothetical protein